MRPRSTSSGALSFWTKNKVLVCAEHAKCHSLIESFLGTKSKCNNIYIYINMYSNRVQQDIKRKQSRESVSKADLPADIFEQYKKVSEFTVLNLKDLNKKGKGGA